MKRLFLTTLILLVTVPSTMMAQKKTIQQAQQLIKTGKELGKAEKLMTDLLKDSNNVTNIKIHLTLLEAVKKQYLQGNEKLYLKQPYDTTALFNTTLKMFNIVERLDSIERSHPEGQKHTKKWRERHVPFLAAIRPNLLYGGRFLAHKQQFQKAYTFYTHYLDGAHHPLFQQFDFAETDTLLPNAARGAMFCAYKLKQPELVLKHAPLAEKIKHGKELAYQFEAEAYHQLSDSTNYINTLHKGFELNPRFPYFFPRIIDYYIEHQQIQQAVSVVDEALKIDGTNPTFRFAQSTLLLNTGNYDACIEICEDLIAENDSMTDAYYNIGLAYFNQAINMEKQYQRNRNVRNTINTLYRKSLPFMEYVRTEQPHQQHKWAQVLYTIYLNLNMGDEFDEISRLINDTSSPKP